MLPAATEDIKNRYTSNKTAWFNRGVTEWWFRDIFITWFCRKFRQDEDANANCIMILDGCSAHNGIQEFLNTNGCSFVKVITLPPNVTSRHQPMDQGVILWTKKKYKYALVCELLDIYSNEEKMKDAVASRKGYGLDGVTQGLRPDVLDAIIRIDQILNEIKEQSIEKCWTKADCLPIQHNNENNGDVLREEKQQQNDDNLQVENQPANDDNIEMEIEIGIGDDVGPPSRIEESTDEVVVVGDELDLGYILKSLTTRIRKLDLSNDSCTQNEFVGTVFLEGVDFNP